MSLAAAALFAGCGSSTPAGAKGVRASYSRLLQALAHNDAATVCALMLPAGQNEPRSALIKGAHRLATRSGAAAYRRYIASDCVPEFRDKPDNISGYYRLLRGSRLGAISVDGPLATAAVTSRNARHTRATFIEVQGEWRLVIGVE